MIRTDNSALTADQIKRNLDRILEKVGVDDSPVSGCIGDYTLQPILDVSAESSPDLVTQGLLFDK